MEPRPGQIAKVASCGLRIVEVLMRVDVEPQLLRWARERARLSVGELARRFPGLEAWEAKTLQPTFKQLEHFARTTHTPIGYFFLAEPPVEAMPIPDLRTLADQPVASPSPNLLDTIYLCQQRQDWYRDFARSQNESPLGFVGSAALTDSIVEVASSIRRALNFQVEDRRQARTWSDALRLFIERIDSLGILVTVNGVVGNNTHRKLDPAEFRGFALSDDLAPLLFVNGADTKAAQMFTLAHELAHLWLGESALSDPDRVRNSQQDAERWCNGVAAEVLVPLETFREVFRPDADLNDELQRLARHFKVSSLVVLRRVRDIGRLTAPAFWEAYDLEVARLRAIPRGSGGDFYLTQGARVGKRFARALITSTLEGNTLYRDAFYLLGFSKLATFHELGRSVGIEQPCIS